MRWMLRKITQFSISRCVFHADKIQFSPNPRCGRRAIAQGSSEYNVTILVDAKESVRALRAVHARFYLATLPLAVGIVGPGLIGATFLAQLEQQMEVRCQSRCPKHC